MCATSPVPEGREQRRQRGVTMVELIVAIVVISVAVAGVTGAFNRAVSGSASPFFAKQALAIAEALMEEVQLAAYTYCTPNDPKYVANPDFQAASTADCTAGYVEALGPEAGDVRPFDNVNDYNGLALNPVTDVSGAALPGLAGYSATIAVAPAALNTVPASDALRITVTVTAPNGDAFSLEGYRSRHSPNSMP